MRASTNTLKKVTHTFRSTIDVSNRLTYRLPWPYGEKGEEENKMENENGKMILQEIGFTFKATWLDLPGVNKRKRLATQVKKIEHLFSHDFGEKAAELGIKIELINGK